MPRSAIPQLVPFMPPRGIAGGLSSENAIVVDPTKVVINQNVLVGTAPTRRKRGGQELFQTGAVTLPVAAQAIRGCTEYWKTSALVGGPTSDIFLHQGTKVISIDNRATDGVDRTGALVLDSSAVPCYQVFNDKIYFTSTKTSDGYNMWDGVAASAVAVSDPADGPGRYIISHLGSMIMAGNEDFPFRVYFSVPLDPEDWAGLGSTSLDLDSDGDPQGITGMFSFQNRLYVFTRRSMYEITGTDPTTFLVQRVTNGIGCIAHASIAQTPNDVYWASDRGVHSMRQISDGRITESTFASRDIQRLWTELLNSTLFQRAYGTYDETINCYLLSVPSSGQNTNDSLLVYNIEFGSWAVWENVSARSISTVLVNNKKNLLIGKEDGRLALLNTVARNDFGAGYPYRWKTGVLYPGDRTVKKEFKSITLFCSTTTATQVTLNWDIDGKTSGTKNFNLNAGGTALGAFTLGASALGIGQYVPVTLGLEGVGYGIQIEMVVGGLADIEVYGFILEVDDANMEYQG